MHLALALTTLLLANAATTPQAPKAPADLAAPPATAEKSESGLITNRLTPGSSTEHPAPGDIVKIRYSVWKSDGSVVDWTRASGPAMIAVGRMLPGWSEAVQKMVPGETRRAWIPSSLGGGKIPEGQSFVIDTELVGIVHPPQTPADVAAPPADATKTASGLAYKVLKPGTGTAHPSRHSTVLVHYSGWTTNGQMFDSSVMRDQPIEFPLDHVIKGWTEGLQLMTAGETMRFWIPANLAYGNEPGKPHGMLVFDVELLGIK
ncbi:MAG TPA: FKBP-type peptidyl-prolyl cis-trans isomerase [Thermoanaerobaculia bacterium]|nr:FKBP-type peptidyl-prolyl cis-trans isomerase [Thermoanaerobaculia bacterium]